MWTVGTAIALTAIFGLGYYQLEMNAFFAPRQEAIRRDTMIQSRAYGEAATSELYRMKLEYVRAQSDAERDTIAAYARTEATRFDKTRLPLDLQAWLIQIGG